MMTDDIGIRFRIIDIVERSVMMSVENIEGERTNQAVHHRTMAGVTVDLTAGEMKRYLWLLPRS